MEVVFHTPAQTAPPNSGPARVLEFQSSPIRTHTEADGETWFAAADIARALGYSRFDSNLAARVSDDWRGTKPIRTLGGIQQLTCFNESGVNEFLMRCDKPAVVPFRRWLAGTVLPSIRRHGGYIAGQEDMPDDMLLARALTVANKLIESKTAQLAAAQPAIEFTEAVASSQDAISVAEFAQLIGTGQNRLFVQLRTLKILQSNNRPYQTYLDRGYFRVIENTYTKPDGTHGISTKMLITGRGQVYLSKILKVN